MTGIFDSGSGGRLALNILKGLAPNEELMLYLDRENAPYGVRSREDVARLTERGVRRLLHLGCERVLIACCTASTVYDMLPRDISPYAIPIIEPTANEALRLTKNGKITVIATERTVLSHAFRSAILGLKPSAEVYEIPAQDLVRRVDSGGSRLAPRDREYVGGIAQRVIETGSDTLILGCTHFEASRIAFAEIFKDKDVKIRIVSSAAVGAEETYKDIIKK